MTYIIIEAGHSIFYKYIFMLLYENMYTNTHILIYVYLYIYMCVCVCKSNKPAYCQSKA